MLIIGGKSQGKTEFAINYTGLDMSDVFDCKTGEIENIKKFKIIKSLHLLVKRAIESNISIGMIESELDGKIIICDEIGLGVVPMDKTERLWREETGRLCCRLANKNKVVVRVYCGIPQVIKGEL